MNIHIRICYSSWHIIHANIDMGLVMLWHEQFDDLMEYCIHKMNKHDPRDYLPMTT